MDDSFPTLDGDPAGDDILDFTGDVTGVFLGDTLGDTPLGDESMGSALNSDGGCKSVHDWALGTPATPCGIDS